MNKTQIKKLVKKHMKSTGESAKSFSERSGLSKPTIINLGKNNPTHSTRTKIALALGLPENEFTTYTKERK